jgi:hypothetical protein
MQAIAKASVAMQPLNGLTSLVVRTSQARTSAVEASISIEESIPEDPQPIAPEPALDAGEKIAQVEPAAEREIGAEADPIVINEDDPMPRAAMAPIAPATIDMPVVQGQEIPPNGCPIVMPLCQDDDEMPVMPPKMPYAEDNDPKVVKVEAKKTSGSSEETEESVFKEWMKLFKDEGKENKSSAAEELPPPTEEEPQAESKCQEDSHLHEQYPGCPRTTCPYSGKNVLEKAYKRAWEIDPKLKKKGKEESSEEPPQSEKKKQSGKEQPLKTQGVDTMEYRPSDGGLNEYGPGPIH